MGPAWRRKLTTRLWVEKTHEHISYNSHNKVRKLKQGLKISLNWICKFINYFMQLAYGKDAKWLLHIHSAGSCYYLLTRCNNWGAYLAFHNQYGIPSDSQGIAGSNRLLEMGAPPTPTPAPIRRLSSATLGSMAWKTAHPPPVLSKAHVLTKWQLQKRDTEY